LVYQTPFDQEDDSPKIDLGFKDPLKRSQEGLDERKTVAMIAGTSKGEEEVYRAYKEGEEESIFNEIGQIRQERDNENKKSLLSDAAQYNKELLPDLVEGMANESPTDHSANSVDKEYARKVTEAVSLGSITLPETLEQEPESAYAQMDALEEFTAKSSIIRDIVDQTRSKFNDNSFFDKSVDTAKTFIPFYSWYQKQNAVENAPTSSFLPGNNLQEQIQYLWALPIDRIGPEFQAAVDSIAESSDLEAMVFADAFIEFSKDDKNLENIFGVLDIGSLVPGTLVFKAGTKVGSKLAQKSGQTVKSAGKALMENGPDLKHVADTLGNTPVAATETIVDAGIDTAKVITDTKDLDKILPSVYSMSDIFKDVKNVSSSSIRKLKEAAMDRGEMLKQISLNSVGVDVITAAERKLIAQDILEDIKKVHPNLRNSVINTDITPAENTLDNVDTVDILFGKQDGSLFKTEASAKTWIKRNLQFKDAEVKPIGDAFGITYSKPIPAADRLESIELTTDAVTPNSAGGWFRHLQSDGYNGSMQAIKDRRTVSDLSEKMGRVIEAVGEPIQKLSNKGRQEVEKVLSFTRENVKPDGTRSWLNLDEFVDEFKRLNDKLPTDGQVESYVAARQLNELDYVFRDISLMNRKKRLGVEKFRVGPDVEEFEGIQRKEIPFGDSDFFTVVAMKDGKALKTASNNTTAKNQEFFKNLIDEGWTLIQSFEGSTKYAKNKRATFILTQAPERRQIRFGESLNYQAGGHIVPKYPFYIKQGDIQIGANGSRNYKGDNTIWNVMSKKEGQEITKHLEHARQLKKNGDEAGFAKYVDDHLPEMSAKDWKRINLDVPFGVTRAGQRLSSSSYRQGVDFDNNLTTNKFNLSSQLNGQFVGERQDTVVDALFRETDSLIRVEKAELVSPFEGMMIGLRSALDQRVMDDYVFKTANDFSREFGDVLDASANEIRRNPIAFLADPKFKEGADPVAVTKAKKIASVTNNILGRPTPASRALQTFKETLAEDTLARFGRNSMATKIVNERLIHTVKDPAVYFRSLAFHTKMGLFNVKQLFLQSQALTQIASIGGTRDTLGSIPAYIYGYGLRLTRKPGMLEDAAERVARIPGSGFTKKEFLESQRALDESGWDIIGGSVAMRDMYEGPSITRSTIGNTLELGTTPFKKGEHIGRVMAWHVAYKNWKKANPNKTLDRAGKQWIQLRASDLTSNMTRDMNASWQRGMLSVPTQFWGFQARVFEQMMSPSSRLTFKERARLFSGISLMYGVPVGLGAATQFLPVNKAIKSYILEEGMEEQVEDSFLLETARDGIFSTSIEMLTGMDFDTSNFGPAGNEYFSDMVEGNLEWYEMFGGAGASIAANIASDVLPALSGIEDAITLDNKEGGMFSINEAEVIDLLNTFQVSSLDNATKLWKALNTGKWISRNGTILGDVSVQEAFVSSITGLSTEDISETFLRLDSGKKVKELIRSGQKQVTSEYQRARLALDKKDVDAFTYHMKKAKQYGIENGLTSSHMSQSYKDGFDPKTLEEVGLEVMNDYVVKHKERLERGTK